MVALTILSSCNQAKENKAPTNDGYTLIKSDNIEFAKKTLINAAKGDLDGYRALYADTAVFYNNAEKESVDQNVELLKQLQAHGISMSLDKFDAVFEAIDNEANPEIGTNDYIFIYCTVTFTKGDKKVTIPFHQANALKGGKIIREWDFYDASGLNELMK